MPRYFLPVAIVLFLVGFVAANTFYVVRQDRQAIILRLGEYQGTVNIFGTNDPGLRVKIPFADTVINYSKRNLGLQLDTQTIVASDQEQLRVDAVLRWRIVSPRRFYQSAQTIDGGEGRISAYAEAAIRRALGAATSNEIISGRRAELMQQIEDNLNATVAAELGVSIIDVRIRQADLPDQTRERVYARMRSERAQVAGRLRAEGAREAEIIRATARQEGERLRGEGDGERSRTFANAYGRDPEFAAFYRSMRAYENAIGQGTPIIVSPDSDFLRYMQRRQGTR
jgi:membrane protease subunit HflC